MCVLYREMLPIIEREVEIEVPPRDILSETDIKDEAIENIEQAAARRLQKLEIFANIDSCLICRFFQVESRLLISCCYTTTRT